MKYFFEPNGIAVIGASSQKGKIGNEVLRSLISSGYKKLYPINPKEEEILGIKCYKRIEEIDNQVDLAVIVLASEKVLDAIKGCGKKGVKGIVIISAGFKEVGLLEYEKNIVETAKGYGMRIIGPNCIGIFDGKSGMNTFFQPNEMMRRPKYGNIAFLTQSGTYGCTLLEWLADEGIGVSKFVSYGNKCDVDEIDMLNYLEKDKETKVISLYLEGINDGRKFMKILKEVTVSKPVVLLKAGKTNEGARAAASHTGAIAINEIVFSSAMRQCGAIEVEEMEEMLDVLKIISTQKLPFGGKIGMVTNGVGPCVVAIDFLRETSSLKLGVISEEGIKELKNKLPSYCIFENPIDLTGSATAEMYATSIKLLEKEKNIDIIMPFYVFQDAPLGYTVDELHNFLKSFKTNKTIVCVAGGSDFSRSNANKMQSYNIPVIPTAKRAMLALDKIVKYCKWRDRYKNQC
ncbi:MAG: CoA-binding protein [Candidatus Thermoplasmatota archaeon]